MNIKDLVLKNMPDGLNDLEKARYVYLMLASKVSFSTKFQNTTEEEFAKMYVSKINIDKFDSNQIICRWWASIYSTLLNEVGVENKIVDYGHQYVSFKYDNKIWVADATYGSYTDLSRIKYGDDTAGFGISIVQDENAPSNFIRNYDEDKNLIDTVDEKIGFSEKKKKALRNIKEDINYMEKNIDFQKKLEILFERIGVLSDGYYEAKSFVRNLEYSIFTQDEMKNIHSVEFKRTNNKSEVDIVQCIYLEKENDQYAYYLLAPNLPIKKVEPELISKLAILGYGKDSDKQIPGVIYPIEFRKGNINTNSFKYKLRRRFVSGSIKEYDIEQIGKLR